MTYNVFSGTINPAQSINQSSSYPRSSFLKQLQTRWPAACKLVVHVILNFWNEC